jgi:hypothetical protein
MNDPVQSTIKEIRDVLEDARIGRLSVLDFQTGSPLGALVNVAVDDTGYPVFLLSGLSRHTRCILSDPRCSLLVQGKLPKEGDALTAFRACIVGKMVAAQDDLVRQRYLARHPYSEMYASFGDFGFWRLEPERVFVVAGFGRVMEFEAREVFGPVD